MTFQIAKKISPVAFVVWTALLAVVCLVFLLNRQSWNEHTHSAIAQINGVERLIVDLETGQRGYIITGRVTFLEPYFQAKTSLFRDIRSLKEFVADNPPQVKLLEDIEALIQEWFENAGTPGINAKERIITEADPVVKARLDRELVERVTSEIGKASIDEIRLKAYTFIGEERRLLVERQRQRFFATLLAILVILGGSVFSIFLMKTLHSRERTLNEDLESKNRQLEKEKYAAISANQAKKEFVANMSHELRTPLNAVIGYSELIDESLEDGVFDEGVVKEDLSKINSSARHLLSMVDNLLDFSRLETSTIELLEEAVELGEFLNDIANSGKILARSRSNGFAVENTCFHDKVKIDPLRVRQVLLNLIGNACKFTENGQVDLSVYEQQDRLFFVVKDTGVGIDSSKRERIFQPFTREVKDDKIKGTGLGLSICREIVTLMDGTITVDSAPGKGSTFSVQIPLKVPLMKVS